MNGLKWRQAYIACNDSGDVVGVFYPQTNDRSFPNPIESQRALQSLKTIQAIDRVVIQPTKEQVKRAYHA